MGVTRGLWLAWDRAQVSWWCVLEKAEPEELHEVNIMARPEPGNPLSSSNSAIWMSCQTWRLMLTILTITALSRLRQEDYRRWETSLGCGGRMEANGKSPGEDRLVFIVAVFGSGFPLELGCCVHEDAVSLL